MPTDPNMTGLIYPTEGSDSDIWDTILNTTCWPVIGAHNHTTGSGVPVPSGGLRINADVPWAYNGTSYAITAAKALDFTPVAVADVAAYSSALFTNSADNNLYFRNSSGVNVKIIDGSTLNVSIVGGIGGDYSSVSALFDYDDATDTYRARQETAASVRQYAKLSIADLIIREYDAAGDATVPANTVTVKSPDALAASYALTLPAALPASTKLLAVSSAGVLAAAESAVLTGDVDAADFRYTGSQPIVLAASAVVDRAAAHTKSTGGTSLAWNRTTIAASVEPLVWPIPVKGGDRIVGYTVNVDKNTTGSALILAQLYMTSGADGVETPLGSSDDNDTDNPGFIQLFESGLTIDVDEENQYYLIFRPSGSVAGAADVLYHAAVYVTRP